MVITGLLTMLLAVLIGNMSFEKTRSYSAIFSDATGVVKGDDIRIAGVRVGNVKNVEIVNRNQAKVEFSVIDKAELTRSSTATIKYRNIVGQRYIALTRGADDLTRLPDGGTLPEKNTSPAVDLTTVFNGFKPLFAALSPADINKLSAEIVQVFQGESGNIRGLLESTASVTTTLAERDQIIGQMINNLNSVLVTVSSRDKQLTSLILQLKSFMAGLVKDKDAILGSLTSVSALTDETASLTKGIRPGLVQDIKGLRTVAGTLAKNRAILDTELQIMPIKLDKLGRTSVYGTYFNFYLCNFTADLQTAAPSNGAPNGHGVRIKYDNQVPRCNQRTEPDSTP